VIDDLKGNTDKQLNEVRKSIQDLDEKFSNMDEKFSKEIEILEKLKNVGNEKLNDSNKNPSGKYQQ
jgi:hypothetical protein